MSHPLTLAEMTWDWMIDRDHRGRSILHRDHTAQRPLVRSVDATRPRCVRTRARACVCVCVVVVVGGGAGIRLVSVTNRKVMVIVPKVGHDQDQIAGVVCIIGRWTLQPKDHLPISVRNDECVSGHCTTTQAM